MVRDVFADDRTPLSVTTRGAAAEVRRVLRPGGLYLANCADRPPLSLARAEVATLREVLDDVMVVAEPGVMRGRRYGNLVLVGGRHDLDVAALARALRCLPVPARLLEPDEAAAFARGAHAIEDRDRRAGPVLSPDVRRGRTRHRARPRRRSQELSLRAGGPSPPAGPWGPG